MTKANAHPPSHRIGRTTLRQPATHSTHRALHPPRHPILLILLDQLSAVIGIGCGSFGGTSCSRENDRLTWAFTIERPLSWSCGGPFAAGLHRSYGLPSKARWPQSRPSRGRRCVKSLVGRVSVSLQESRTHWNLPTGGHLLVPEDGHLNADNDHLPLSRSRRAVNTGTLMILRSPPPRSVWGGVGARHIAGSRARVCAFPFAVMSGPRAPSATTPARLAWKGLNRRG